MRVFYYQWHNDLSVVDRARGCCPGGTYIVCVKGPNAGADSPIWRNPNTCSWLVPTGAIDDPE